jgi:hypothetical protein
MSLKTFIISPLNAARLSRNLAEGWDRTYGGFSEIVAFRFVLNLHLARPMEILAHLANTGVKNAAAYL